MGNDIDTGDAPKFPPTHSITSSMVIKPPVPNQSKNSSAEPEHSHSSGSKSKSKRMIRLFGRSKSQTNTSAVDSVPSGVPSLQRPLSNSNRSYRSSTFQTSSKSNQKKVSASSAMADISKISNGVTGAHINARVVKIAAEFWSHFVDNKTMEEKLELGCSIFFEMMAHSSEMKNILKRNLLSRNVSIESSSLKFLDMMGWLLRSLMRTDVDLTVSLTQLGALHRNMGITIDYFDPMLTAMHATFSYYFPFKYSIQIKYAIDQIFTLAARIMTGQNLHAASNGSHLQELNDEMKDGAFLTSLSVCLESNIGREYLYRYLQQTLCDEIAIFLQSMKKFRQQTSDKERFMVARDVVKSCVEPQATFAVNISYELRQQTLANMKELERVFFEKDVELTVPKDLFVAVEGEMYKLIMENHWRKFAHTFKHMHAAHEQ